MKTEAQHEARGRPWEEWSGTRAMVVVESIEEPLYGSVHRFDIAAVSRAVISRSLEELSGIDFSDQP